MFVHNKSLQFEVRVTQPDPRFASLMLEQFGGANGELAPTAPEPTSNSRLLPDRERS